MADSLRSRCDGRAIAGAGNHVRRCFRSSLASSTRCVAQAAAGTPCASTRSSAACSLSRRSCARTAHASGLNHQTQAQRFGHHLQQPVAAARMRQLVQKHDAHPLRRPPGRRLGQHDGRPPPAPRGDQTGARTEQQFDAAPQAAGPREVGAQPMPRSVRDAGRRRAKPSESRQPDQQHQGADDHAGEPDRHGQPTNDVVVRDRRHRHRRDGGSERAGIGGRHLHERQHRQEVKRRRRACRHDANREHPVPPERRPRAQRDGSHERQQQDGRHLDGQRGEQGHHTSSRLPAPDRRVRTAGTGPARGSTHAPLPRARVRHDACNPFELRLGQASRLPAEQRRHRLFGGPVEERLDEMSQRGAARGPARRHRAVHVPQALLLMAHVPLLLEDAELRADRRRAGVAGELRPDDAGRGAAAPEKDVHDLPLATRQPAVPRCLHAHEIPTPVCGRPLARPLSL